MNPTEKHEHQYWGDYPLHPDDQQFTMPIPRGSVQQPPPPPPTQFSSSYYHQQPVHRYYPTVRHDRPDWVSNVVANECLDCGVSCQTQYRRCRRCETRRKPIHKCPNCDRFCRGRQCATCHRIRFNCVTDNCSNRKASNSEFCHQCKPRIRDHSTRRGGSWATQGNRRYPEARQRQRQRQRRRSSRSNSSGSSGSSCSSTCSGSSGFSSDGRGRKSPAVKLYSDLEQAPTLVTPIKLHVGRSLDDSDQDQEALWLKGE